MKFLKAHSLGNDFIFLDTGEYRNLNDLPGLTLKLCDRHMGIGSDGLLFVRVEDADKGVARFRIFNADGTEPEISGNGLRCAAACLHFKQKVKTPTVTLLTRTGPRECTLLKQERNLFQLRLDHGIPKFASKDIPFDNGSDLESVVDFPLTISGRVHHVTLVNVGNPHCVIFIDSLPARIEWHQIGREIESHPFFPNRVNIEFVRLINPDEIEVLFWERGVGETLSSGSGSAAAAVASILKKKTGRKVTVRTPMGRVVVEWETDRVFQVGPAEIVYEGTII